MTQLEANALPSGSVSVLSPQQLEDWLRLLLAPSLGACALHELLEEYNDAALVLDAMHNRAISTSSKLRKGLAQSHEQTRDRCLEWQNASKRRHIICWNDPDYPPLLKELRDSPPLLFIEGQPENLHQPQLAIVGSRKATPVGLETTRQFAHALSQHGLVITSGLALGIDASAHIGALNAGGKTIAVLGNGLDKIYPARHQALAEEIIEQGTLISEFPPGTPPLAQHFPRRNRIISGLSLGVLVVEAAVRSGSLITARLAGEQGRSIRCAWFHPEPTGPWQPPAPA